MMGGRTDASKHLLHPTERDITTTDESAHT